jgi:lipopolysaccharide export system protein LptC
MGTPAPRVSLGRLAAGAGFVLVAYVAWGIYRAGLNETAPPPASTDIVFHEGVANGERITTRSWTAQYDKLVSNADQTVLDLQNVRNGTIFKAGKPYLHIRAAHMTVNTLTRDFAVSGRLHVETVSSRPARSFDTTAAHWSDAQQQLDLTHRVSIDSGAGAPLVVGSLTFDVKTGQLELHDVAGPVRFK